MFDEVVQEAVERSEETPLPTIQELSCASLVQVAGECVLAHRGGFFFDAIRV
jgi:hypothetical protein